MTKQIKQAVDWAGKIKLALLSLLVSRGGPIVSALIAAVASFLINLVLGWLLASFPDVHAALTTIYHSMPPEVQTALSPASMGIAVWGGIMWFINEATNQYFGKQNEKVQTELRRAGKRVKPDKVVGNSTVRSLSEVVDEYESKK